MDAAIFRIKNTIKKILPFTSINVDKGSRVSWIDISLGDIEVSIECHSNSKFGICIPNEDKKFLKMANYYVDNHIEAVDIALKILVD